MRQRNSWRAALVVMAAVAAPVGCGRAPGVSNGSVSSCYRAIPVGRSAVHDDRAVLLGVHRVPVDAVRSHLPAAARAELAVEDDQTVCEMSFRGRFAPGQVELAPPGQAGRFAVVLVSSKRLHLVGAVVLDTLPRSLGGRTV
ncbi:MAG TPA: hypothetical protein VFN68_04680 [Acidimicrobiales bacterium]|nr:hypothetical protein [Acidimicrobiales bacterium]